MSQTSVRVVVTIVLRIVSSICESEISSIRSAPLSSTKLTSTGTVKRQWYALLGCPRHARLVNPNLPMILRSRSHMLVRSGVNVNLKSLETADLWVPDRAEGGGTMRICGSVVRTLVQR